MVLVQPRSIGQKIFSQEGKKPIILIILCNDFFRVTDIVYLLRELKIAIIEE